jgi:Icc-related predicted phosphoesterase
VKDSGKVIHFKVMDENGVFKDHTRPGTFLPADAAWDHELFIKFATKQLDFLKDQKVVMVTHHAPTFRSIDPAYAHDTVMNYAYASDLSEFILDHPQIKIWIHGHMHHRQEYCVGETIVTSNPRGYVRHQRSADTFEIEYIEV